MLGARAQIVEQDDLVHRNALPENLVGRQRVGANQIRLTKNISWVPGQEIKRNRAIPSLVVLNGESDWIPIFRPPHVLRLQAVALQKLYRVAIWIVRESVLMAQNDKAIPKRARLSNLPCLHARHLPSDREVFRLTKDFPFLLDGSV